MVAYLEGHRYYIAMKKSRVTASVNEQKKEGGEERENYSSVSKCNLEIFSLYYRTYRSLTTAKKEKTSRREREREKEKKPSNFYNK